MDRDHQLLALREQVKKKLADYKEIVNSVSEWQKQVAENAWVMDIQMRNISEINRRREILEHQLTEMNECPYKPVELPEKRQ